MNKSTLFVTALSAPLLAGVATAAPGWNVFKHGNGSIYNYATADALIGGSGLAFSDTSPYPTSNTQDNGDGGGLFGLGMQVAGLPAGDNNDFVFRGIAQFDVDNTGTYVFGNNTDDGSRLRISVNGGAYSTIIVDDVLSGPHSVLSGGVTLNAGDTINLDWMWFERGGGAEGESWYQFNGGPNALWEDATQGLTLAGGAYTGTMFKSLTLPDPANLALADALVTGGPLLGSGIFPSINFGAGGRAAGESEIPGGGGDNFTLSASGYIYLPGGDYTFFTNTDDGARLRIDGSDVVVDDVLQGPSDSAYVVMTLAAGEHFLEYTGFELGGGESFELWMAEGNLSAPKGSGSFTGDFHLVGDAAFPVYSSPIPEPSAAGMAALALLGLARRRRA